MVLAAADWETQRPQFQQIQFGERANDHNTTSGANELRTRWGHTTKSRFSMTHQVTGLIGVDRYSPNPIQLSFRFILNFSKTLTFPLARESAISKRESGVLILDKSKKGSRIKEIKKKLPKEWETLVYSVV